MAGGPHAWPVAMAADAHSPLALSPYLPVGRGRRPGDQDLGSALLSLACSLARLLPRSLFTVATAELRLQRKPIHQVTGLDLFAQSMEQP